MAESLCSSLETVTTLFVNRLCAVLCLVAQSHPTLHDPMDCKPTRLLSPWGFSRQESWSELPCPPPEDLPDLGLEPRSSTLQSDSLTSAPPGKPKKTRMGSLSLLQGIFLNQESNRVSCNAGATREAPDQLSHQRSDQSLSRVRLFATP